MRTFVCGDIHGGAKALIQVLEQANFDKNVDKLIALGDVCDGWSETPEAIEELMSIKNLIYIKGNHDQWAYRGLTKDREFLSFHGDGSAWRHHGGKATEDAYERRPELIEKHIEFLKNANLYHLDEQNRLFVHAGINHILPIDKNDEDTLIWDRNFWYGVHAGRNHGKAYKEVYIGHTPTLNFPDNKGSQYKPINRHNVWNMDTGAAFTGKLSMMDIDTKELYQSELVRSLYPNEFGRNRATWFSENPTNRYSSK